MSHEENDRDCGTSKMRDSVEKDLEMSDSDDDAVPSSTRLKKEKKGRTILDSDEDNDDGMEDDHNNDGKVESNDKEEDGGGEYVVEKILAQKKRGRKTFFLIKWKGWGDGDNTWEPEEHLSCPELLEEFRKEEARRQSEKTEKPDTSSKSEAKKRQRISKSIKKERRPKVQSKESENKFSSSDLIGVDEDDDEDDGSITGFERGLEAEKIMGAIQLQDKIMFLMKWKGSQKLDLVQAEEANIKCPYVVIEYYEKRLEWIPDSKNEECLS